MSQAYRRLTAIMFTDMVGYTALAQRDETEALSVLDRYRRRLRPIFAHYGGSEVKSIGDAFLVGFDSSVDAVRCAVVIQTMLHDDISGTLVIPIRIGIHLGEVVHEDGDIFGDAVNIAARIEPLAEPGGICVSKPVYDNVSNKLNHEFESLGVHELKNVERSMEVYRLVMTWDTPRTSLGGGRKGVIMPDDRIAVLPFVNISPDARDEYFADGLTEEMISKLTQVRGLKVIARTSVMNYKKKEKKVSEIGRELGVGTLIEGSVRKSGKRIRVTVQLVDVNTEEHIWSADYDKDLDDIFAVQSDIASKVTRALIPSLVRRRVKLPNERETEDLTAYTYFLQGTQLLHEETEEALKKALSFFERAVRREPTFARAYVGMARCYLGLGCGSFVPFIESFEQAKIPLQKALEINPELADAYAALSSVRFAEDDFHGAESEAKKAIRLNPNLTDAYLSLSHVKAIQGRLVEALALSETAYQLDPLAPDVVYNLGQVYLYLGKEADVIEHWRRTLSIMPFETYAQMMECYLDKRDDAKAIEICSILQELRPTSNETIKFAGGLAALTGDREKADQAIARLRRSSKRGSTTVNQIGYVQYCLGDLDGFFESMFQAMENHALPLLALMYSPLFARVRADPRYDRLLEKLGIGAAPQN